MQELLEEIPKDDIKSTSNGNAFQPTESNNRKPRLTQNQQRNDFDGIMLETFKAPLTKQPLQGVNKKKYPPDRYM